MYVYKKHEIRKEMRLEEGRRPAGREESEEELKGKNRSGYIHMVYLKEIVYINPNTMSNEYMPITY